MICPNLYHKTVGILVDAYYHDTLEVGNYCACAVGNIIAANLGYKIIKKDEEEAAEWEGVSESLISNQWYWLINDDKLGEHFNEPIAKYQIDSTGYSIEEIIQMEDAFEDASGETEDEEMFNGLMAVIDVLDEIHENTDSEISKESKKKFIKEAANLIS